MKQKRALSGFTLIEVLVTLLVVLGAIGAYTAMIYSVFLTKDAKDEEFALHIAENELETLRAGGYSALPASGSFSDSQLSSLSSGSGTVTVSDFNTKTKQVAVSVSWNEPGKGSRSVSLTTLVTQSGGLK